MKQEMFTLRELRGIVKSWSEGQKIQYLDEDGEAWQDVPAFAALVPVSWTLDRRYRVKDINPSKQTLYFAGFEDADGHIRFGQSSDDLTLLRADRQHTLRVEIQGTTSRYISAFGANIKETEVPEPLVVGLVDEE